MRNRRPAAIMTAFLLCVPLAAAAQSSNTETYQQLNLFGDVFDKVRSDYVDFSMKRFFSRWAFTAISTNSAILEKSVESSPLAR